MDGLGSVWPLRYVRGQERRDCHGICYCDYQSWPHFSSLAHSPAEAGFQQKVALVTGGWQAQRCSSSELHSLKKGAALSKHSFCAADFVIPATV